MSIITKSSTITFSSQILIFVLGFVASIILARVLGPDGKGIYALIVLIPALMLKLGSLGIEAANVYFTGSKRYEIKDVVSNSLLSSILLGLILISLFFGVSHLDIFQNFLNSNRINPLYLWVVVLTLPFSLLSGFLISIILGAEKIMIYNKINIFNAVFQLILLIVFLVIFKKGVLGAVLSYVFGIVASVLLVIAVISKGIGIAFSFNQRLLRDSTKYGAKAYFGNLTQFLNYRLDMLLVAAFLTPATVGFYSLAVGMSERLWMLPGAIATVLFPRVSAMKESEADSLTPRIARHTFFIIFIFALILALTIRPLIKILFGSAFLPAAIPLMILLPGIIALGVCKILTADLAGRGKPQIGAYSAFVSLTANLPLNLWLIPKWGIAGAAFASSIAYIIATLIVILAFVKISNTSWLAVLVINKHDFQDYKTLLTKLKKGEQNVKKRAR